MKKSISISLLLFAFLMVNAQKKPELSSSKWKDDEAKEWSVSIKSAVAVEFFLLQWAPNKNAFDPRWQTMISPPAYNPQDSTYTLIIPNDGGRFLGLKDNWYMRISYVTIDRVQASWSEPQKVFVNNSGKSVMAPRQ